MKYNVLAGMDNTMFNNVINQVYTAIYPQLFKGKIDVNNSNISSIEFDMDISPTVDLRQAKVFEDFMAKQLDVDQGKLMAALSKRDKKEMMQASTGSTFELEAPSLKLVINYIDDTDSIRLDTELSGSVRVTASNDTGVNLLTASIIRAQLSIPSSPEIEAVLNLAFIPLLIIYLNEQILEPIEIPVLGYGSLQISLPTPAVQSPYFTVYSALGDTQPNIPVPHDWPDDYVYFGTDHKVLEAAAAIPFPLGPTESFNWRIIKGRLRAQVLAPNPIRINADGRISATITANALAQLTVSTPWPLPNFTFGPSATARLSVSFRPTVENNKLYITPTGVPTPGFSFSWGSIPNWVAFILRPLLNGLARALNAVFGPLIRSALRGIKIEVYTLPAISFRLGGKRIAININEATTSTGGPNGGLLLVSAKMAITSAKSKPPIIENSTK